MASPSVQVYEQDRTFNINSIESSVAAMVGVFRWGPVNEPTMVYSNETELVKKFGRPDSATEVSFLSASNYLLYANPLYIVRAIDTTTAKNAISDDSQGAALLLKNEDDYLNATIAQISFIARYPGELGNSLRVSLATGGATYSSWEFANVFSYTPAVGQYNLVVIDATGFISGIPGSILEKYELLSLVPGDKRTDGTSAYIKSVLVDQSQYILMGAFTDTNMTNGIFDEVFKSGIDGNTNATVDYATAIGTLGNQEKYDIICVFGAGVPTTSVGTLADMTAARKDAVAFIAPPISAVYNVEDPSTTVSTFFNTTVNKNNSYTFYVDNQKLVYNRYSDANVWIPCDSDAAGLWARTFVQNAPWISPAGFNRGQLKNVIRLAWSANKPQRDILYANSINSIVSFPGEGNVLFGDKTSLMQPSAFSRINVRGLFIVIEKSIARAARAQLFEINDVITRTIFKNANDRYLDNVQGQRGIDKFQVVCDETNNTPQVINANQFVGDIFISPARSINNIILNFIAVDSGVSFNEIEGKVNNHGKHF